LIELKCIECDINLHCFINKSIEKLPKSKGGKRFRESCSSYDGESKTQTALKGIFAEVREKVEITEEK
jgi:hypothetical protein